MKSFTEFLEESGDSKKSPKYKGTSVFVQHGAHSDDKNSKPTKKYKDTPVLISHGSKDKKEQVEEG